MWKEIRLDITHKNKERKEKEVICVFFTLMQYFVMMTSSKYIDLETKKERTFFCVSYGEKKLAIGGSGQKIRFLAVALLESR